MTRTTKTPAETSAPDDDLLGLLKFSTVVEGVGIGDLLRERQERAEARVQAHANGAEDAALAGEEAQQAHEAEAARLQRELDRLGLAINRADQRLAEVSASERLAQGERHARAAEAHAKRAEEIVVAYVAAAQQVGTLLDALQVECKALADERYAAQTCGADCDAKLPHEARFRPARHEYREVVSRQLAPGVYDQHGRPVDLKRNGVPEMIETRNTVRVCVDVGCAAADVTRARVVLPDPNGGTLIDRGRD
jgi:hypothetical protein